jgi:hypothetical protein
MHPCMRRINFVVGIAVLVSSREYFQHQYKTSTVAYELFADDNGRPLSLVNTDSCRWRRILECFVTFCIISGVFTIRWCTKGNMLAYACLSLTPHVTIQECETIAFPSYTNVYRPLTNLQYFSIDNAHLMYNAQPKLFRHSLRYR